MLKNLTFRMNGPGMLNAMFVPFVVTILSTRVCVVKPITAVKSVQ